jgi:hypothetical protein
LAKITPNEVEVISSNLFFSLLCGHVKTEKEKRKKEKEKESSFVP